jgi:predicted DNA-binding transcriptional regulator YafY
MEEQKSEKTARVLGLYTKLLNGHVINKNVEANLYGVNERSIERDIEALRLFLAEQHLMRYVMA